METRFVNSFEVTEEIFVSWAKTPVNRLATPLKFLLWAFELLLIGGLLWFGVRSGRMLMALFLAAAVFFMNVRGPLTAGADARKRWAEMKKALGDQVWTRETRFTEHGAVLSDNGSTTEFTYDRLTSLSDQADFGVLVFDKHMAVRLKKDSFVQGDWDSLVAFLEEKTTR